MVEKEEEKPKEKKTDETWGIGDIATDTEPRIVNLKTNEIYTVEQTLASIKNDLEKLKKLLD